MKSTKYRIIQWVEISNGILWIAIALVMVPGYVYLVQTSAMSVFVFVLMLVMMLSLFELGWYWIARNKQLRDVLAYQPPKRLSAKAGSILGMGVLFLGILRTLGIFILIGIGFYAVAKYLSITWTELLKPWIIVLFITCVIYGIFRTILLKYIRRIFKPILDWFVGGYPTYAIDAKGLTLYLGEGFPEDKRKIPILFSELDEVKIFSRFESMAFQKYIIGPDIQLGARALADKIAFLAGKIPRPKFFDYLSSASGAKTLFLCGPSITYFVGLSKQNGDDLIAAFQKSKK